MSGVLPFLTLPVEGGIQRGLTWSNRRKLCTLVNVASTISLDAAYLDKPIVCVAFDGNDRRKSYFESCRRIYDFTCWQNVVRCGGVRIATTRDRLFIGLMFTLIIQVGTQRDVDESHRSRRIFVMGVQPREWPKSSCGN